MDHADIAGDTIAACTEDALRRQLGKSAPETHSDFDGQHCVEEDCQVEIPAARLALGRIRCVTCQGLLEVRAAGRGRNIRVIE